MKIFSSLGFRIPVASVALVLASIVFVSLLSITATKTEIRRTAYGRLDILVESYRQNVESAFNQSAVDLKNLSSDISITRNFGALTDNFDPSQPEYQTIMADFRAGRSSERIDIYNTNIITAYGRIHTRLHDPIRRLLLQKPYADALLIDPDGRIVYSARKGLDFGSSLQDPRIAHTGLARLFGRLEGVPEGVVQFEDFAAYPFGGGRSAFLGIPLMRRANVAMGTYQESVRIGYLVLRIKTEMIDAALAPSLSLKAGSVVRVLGPDGAARNVAGLDAHTLPDDELFSVSREISALGARWSIEVQEPRNQALAGLNVLIRKVLFGAAIIAALAVAIGLQATNMLVRPLIALTHALQQMSRREWIEEIPGKNRSDEIGAIARAVVAIRDMTADTAKAETDLYRKLSAANERLANLDPLTMLSNRRGFFARLSFRKAELEIGQAGGVIVCLAMDLDGFKPVNDGFGHAAGDRVLIEVASRLRSVCGDDAMVGRLGGDEFIVVIENSSELHSIGLARSIIAEVKRDIALADGRSVNVGMSVGIAFQSANGLNLDLLLSQADAALYAAKAGGRGTCRVYSEGMSEAFHGDAFGGDFHFRVA